MKKFYLQKNFQLVYGLILVILVPVVVVLNTLALNNNFRDNIEIQLQRQALAFGQLFNVSLQQGEVTPENIQSLITATLAVRSDIKAIQVLNLENDTFRIVASSDAGEVNRQVSATHYFFAWYQHDAIANLVNTEQVANLFQGDWQDQAKDRYWLVVMPLSSSEGESQQLLSMVISLDVMDQLIASTLTRSYIFLTLTVLFLILLLAANSRLFEQAVLYRKIKEVDEMKDEFISIASHELRTPLTVIKGYVSMLQSEESKYLSVQAYEYLKAIANSSDRMAELVEDLLNVSRIEQGRLQFDMQLIEPETVISQVVKELKVPATEKDLNLASEYQVAGVQIKVDPKRLHQVLVNLVGNAVKYTPAGSVTVQCFIKNKRLVIKVADTGVGMSAKDRERLFEKFYRIRNDQTRDITGTGLGLWITKQIVEMMDGEIFVDSIEGVGTQISLLFPYEETKS